MSASLDNLGKELDVYVFFYIVETVYLLFF